jgi:hypothetical protein
MMTNLQVNQLPTKLWYYFSAFKIVEVININADDTQKEFLLEGHSGAALDTVSHMFEGVGFNTYVSQIN